MEQKSDISYPSASPEKVIDLEQRLEKKVKGVTILNSSFILTKKLITYFKDTNRESKKKYEKYRTLTITIEIV